MSDSETLSNELNELCTALKRINQRLQSETVPDLMVLNEFRHSLDNARLTAWSVSELVNAQRARKEPAKVLAFLSAERLRRLDELIRNLSEDIERRVITFRTHGVHSLSNSVRVLQQKLARSLAEQRESATEVGGAGR